MQDSTVFKMFQFLNDEEIEAVQKWVKSPFFNTRPDVITLYSYFYSIRAIRNDNKIIPALQKKIFLEKHNKWKEARLNQAMTALLQAMKDYLAYTNYKADESNYYNSLLSVAKRRPIFHEQELTRWKKHLEKINIRNTLYYQSEYHYALQKIEISKDKSDKELPFHDLVANLSIYATGAILHSYCGILQHQILNNIECDNPFLEKFYTTIPDFTFLFDLPYIQVYYYCIKFTKDDEDEKSYDKFKTIFFDNENLFSLIERRDLYTIGSNFCARKLRKLKDKDKFKLEAFRWYIKGIENKFLLIDNVLEASHYRSTVKLGLDLQKKVADVEQESDKIFINSWDAFAFINEYKQYILLEQQNVLHQYALALYYFQTRAFDKVFEIVNKFNSSIGLINMDVRTIKCCIFYIGTTTELNIEDLNPFDALENQFRSYPRYIDSLENKKMLSAGTIPLYINFINFLEKIYNADLLEKSELRTQLYEEINDCADVVEKDWLLSICR